MRLSPPTYRPSGNQNVPKSQSDMSVRVLTSENGKCSPSENSRTQYRGHSRIPSEVTADPRLKDRDVRVYAAIALFERGGNANVGYRWISQACNVTISQIGKSLHRLEQFGYLESTGGRGQRREYKLLSPVFEPKPARVTLKTCPKCSRMAKLNRAGWCTRCAQAVTYERLVEHAREELGVTASDEQIVTHIEARELKRNVTRALRASVRRTA